MQISKSHKIWKWVTFKAWHHLAPLIWDNICVLSCWMGQNMAANLGKKRESEMVRIESPPKMAKMAKINDFGVNGQLWSSIYPWKFLIFVKQIISGHHLGPLQWIQDDNRLFLFLTYSPPTCPLWVCWCYQYKRYSFSLSFSSNFECLES